MWPCVVRVSRWLSGAHIRWGDGRRGRRWWRTYGKVAEEGEDDVDDEVCAAAVDDEHADGGDEDCD